jgi:hypothetical protein
VTVVHFIQSSEPLFCKQELTMISKLEYFNECDTRSRYSGASYIQDHTTDAVHLHENFVIDFKNLFSYVRISYYTYFNRHDQTACML